MMTALLSRPSRVAVQAFDAPRRGFAKRVVADGFSPADARRRAGKRKAGGFGGPPAGSPASGTAAAAAAAEAVGGDSVAAMEAENEERLRRLLLPVLSAVAAQPTSRDALAGEGEGEDARGSEEERVRDVLFERASLQRFRSRELRLTFALSAKLRRRWEALNALTPELRALCSREHRRALPAHLPVPRDCYGRAVLPDTDGLSGARPLTEKEVKQYLDWQQEQMDKGLPY